MRQTRTEGSKGLRAYETARRAEWRLQQRLETQRWEDDVLIPELQEIEAKGTEGLVIEGKLVELDAAV